MKKGDLFSTTPSVLCLDSKESLLGFKELMQFLENHVQINQLPKEMRELFLQIKFDFFPQCELNLEIGLIDQENVFSDLLNIIWIKKGQHTLSQEAERVWAFLVSLYEDKFCDCRKFGVVTHSLFVLN